MTEYHVNTSLTPEENTEAAIASLKARGLWEERPEWTIIEPPEPEAQQSLALAVTEDAA